MKKIWPALAVLLFVGVASALTTIKPFRASGGVQMQPSAAWNGPNDMGGIYYKADAGATFHTINGEEYVLPKTGGGGSSSLQSAYTAGGAGGGAITTTSSGGGLACTASADSVINFSSKANSPSQSGNLYQSLDSTGVARFEVVPVDAGGTHRLRLTSNVNGSPIVFEMDNSLLATATQWVQGSLTQMAIGGSNWQIFGQGFSPYIANIDGTGFHLQSGMVLSYPDSTTQATAGNIPLYKNATPVTSVTTGEIDAQSYTMPANTLSADGMGVVFDMGFLHAANANSASYKFYAAGTVLTTQARTSSGEAETNKWTCVRETSTKMRCTGLISNSGTLSTSVSLLTSINYASTIIFKTAVLGATTNGDMTSNFLRGELHQ